jgi:dTDP-4-dehydrorhamnose reductase
MHLLVTGASGLLGLNLSVHAVEQGYEVTGVVHSRHLPGAPFHQVQKDLTHSQAIPRMLDSIKPEAIIHCAAIADLNLAERDPQRARLMNSEVPGVFATEAYRRQIPFIHISTDAVFDGTKGDYVETDLPHPLSVYATTKLAGEQMVMESNPDALVARVVFYGWSLSGSRSLSEFFFNHLRADQQVYGFTDVLFSPLYVEDLGAVLLDILSHGLSGIYHVVSPESVSKYEFGVRIAEQFGFDPQLISPIKSSEIDRGAQRSLNLTLNPGRVQAALGHLLPSVDDGIENFFQRWQEGYPDRLHCWEGNGIIGLNQRMEA